MSRAGEIEARLTAATPGEWYWDERFYGDEICDCGGMVHVRTNSGKPIPNTEGARLDANLIANAPADLRWLLDENRDYRKALRSIVNSQETDLGSYARYAVEVAQSALEESEAAS